MRVLGVCSYPKEAASTRFRLEQFVGPLKEFDVKLDVRPFLGSDEFNALYKDSNLASKVVPAIQSTWRRFLDLFDVHNYDLLFVQREAMPFGPAVFEWITRNVVRIPMVLDLDDATYVRYTSPSFGRGGSMLKFFGKTDRLIRSAETVICGNRNIAAYVGSLGTKAVVIPTMVDTNEFRPVQTGNAVPVIGWIGTHSTLPALESIFPVLQQLAQKHQFVLKIVGAGRDVKIDGVEVENRDWSLNREIADFQSIDIGLYPIVQIGSANERWLEGKSGFKAIEYMAVGVPFVMSPVGVCAELGLHGETHFNAVSKEDWYNSLECLLSDSVLRQKMGKEGRQYSMANFDPTTHTETLAGVLRAAADLR